MLAVILATDVAAPATNSGPAISATKKATRCEKPRSLGLTEVR
jgi:hypothetical protein